MRNLKVVRAAEPVQSDDRAALAQLNAKLRTVRAEVAQTEVPGLVRQLIAEVQGLRADLRALARGA